MSLPTSPTSVTQTIPSYLYFQYQNDPDLPSLIDAYNTITQNYVNWFNGVNLPIYPTLSYGTGTNPLLDWIATGIYGYPRPQLSANASRVILGATATYMMAAFPTAIATAKFKPNGQPVRAGTYAVVDDDIYCRCLTWNFYKGDGFQFTIPWLKRRIQRFFYGPNGVSPQVNFTPNIGITISHDATYTDFESLGPTASEPTSVAPTSSFSRTPVTIEIPIRPLISIVLSGVDPTLYNDFVLAVESGAITFPFEYQVSVTTG
jgi:hypothetical protein